MQPRAQRSPSSALDGSALEEGASNCPRIQAVDLCAKTKNTWRKRNSPSSQLGRSKDGWRGRASSTFARRQVRRGFRRRSHRLEKHGQRSIIDSTVNQDRRWRITGGVNNFDRKGLDDVGQPVK